MCQTVAWWQGGQGPECLPHIQCPFLQNVLGTPLPGLVTIPRLKIQLLKYQPPSPALPSPRVIVSFWGEVLTTGQESFSLSQMNVSQCNQTLESLGMFWNRKALNWKVAL